MITMKKILISIFLILILALTVSACSNDSHQSQDETTALESASMVDNVYVDTDRDPGFGYKLCYMSKNLTGNVGIVDSAGNIVIEPLDGKIRFVNTDGEQIIPLEFDSASIHQYNGFFFGSKNTEAGETLYVYDYNGKELCVLNNGDYAELRELEHGYTLLIGNNNNWLKFGLKNSSGKVIIPCKYEEIKVVGADRIVAFDGELESLIETSNVANMFDGDGKQLTKDGEFARIFFDDGDKIGIGCQSATIGAYEPEFWLIDLNGKAESGKYDSIDKDADGNFVCKKGNQTETIKSVK